MVALGKYNRCLRCAAQARTIHVLSCNGGRKGPCRSASQNNWRGRLGSAQIQQTPCQIANEHWFRLCVAKRSQWTRAVARHSLLALPHAAKWRARKSGDEDVDALGDSAVLVVHPAQPACVAQGVQVFEPMLPEVVRRTPLECGRLRVRRELARDGDPQGLDGPVTRQGARPGHSKDHGASERTIC